MVRLKIQNTSALNSMRKYQETDHVFLHDNYLSIFSLVQLLDLVHLVSLFHKYAVLCYVFKTAHFDISIILFTQ